ncbi:MAG: MBL fold metallo-hydrolase [Planctomycetes bacterium]|nr:MBL fold metallo-hydrolase [Planctomycetota bacterium]
MQIEFWGTRGSIPTPSVLARGFSTAKYGGNTTAVSVTSADGLRVLLDAGSGAAAMGDALLVATGFGKQPLAALWFLTHYHWDHVQGFPFFSPAFFPTTRLKLHGPTRKGSGGPRSVLEVINSQQNATNFPVTRAMMPATMEFQEFEPGAAAVARAFDDVALFPTGLVNGHRPDRGFTVRSVLLNHPNDATGYRLEEAQSGRSFCFLTDNEPEPKADERVRAFIAGADLVVMDAQYTVDEYEGRKPPCRRGWGHSTPDHCMALCAAAGVENLYLTHHEPKHDDKFIETMRDAALALARDRYGGKLKVEWAFDCLKLNL